jgi:hypothetical protein
MNTPEERAWEVVRRAYEERVPSRRRAAPSTKVLVAIALLAVLAAGIASSPGRALLDSVREAVGVEHAQPALFSLPASGRLLVVSDDGPWIVQADGSKRRLGDWREASWSPFGRFVIAARANELAALDAQGNVRWSLARPRVRFPRWGGSRTDTRVAYLSGNRLHVVAGDGTHDVDAGAATPIAPAWRPGPQHVLAYVDARGRVRVLDTEGSMLWRTAPYAAPRLLEWSRDGRRLVLATRDRVVTLGNGGKQLASRPARGVVAVAPAPRGTAMALARAREVLVLDRGGATRVFAGSGPFGGLAWSPDGAWLVVSWPQADQWVFVRVRGPHRIRAVSNVAQQFDGFPRLGAWCCPP